MPPRRRHGMLNQTWGPLLLPLTERAQGASKTSTLAAKKAHLFRLLSSSPSSSSSFHLDVFGPSETCLLSHHSKDDEVAGNNEEIHDINYKDRE
ncbi:hypothetical protein TMEN_8740 [Trichophyton mentagrophytes]|nr:hypothetical protein TMEN_8740 [Trichophyton mentagrophytes]